MIVYNLTIPASSLPGNPGRKVMRVERWTTVPATGLWNWLRRRKTVTDKELIGLYVVSGEMKFSHRLNRPDTFEMFYHGTDPSVLLTGR